MSAFTFDLLEISEALIEVKKRGAKVTRVVDEVQARQGHTRYMKEQLAKVIDADVKSCSSAVRLSQRNVGESEGT